MTEGKAQQQAFFATTAKGMEELLAGELVDFGATDVKAGRAGATFRGTLETAYRACLWSRIANRILLPLKTFPAPTPEKLYGGVKSIRWTDHLTPQTTLAVDFSSILSQITHTHFGALKAKDAIVDQMRSVLGERPSVDTARPDVRINIYVNKDEATVSIDLSGESLHQRGYREAGAAAPLKENLAAAILMNAGWSARRFRERAAGASIPALDAFMDPMCGSGTLPIEAAMIASNTAPGLARKHYGFQKWVGHQPAIWKRLVEEAIELEIQDPKLLPRIVGYDQDFRAVRVALDNVERADMRGRVHIEKRELASCEPVAPNGTIAVNPPYGERLGEVEQLKTLYKEIGDTFKKRFQGWDGFVFTGEPELMKAVGLKASRKFVLFNGPIECRLLRYELFAGSRTPSDKSGPTA